MKSVGIHEMALCHAYLGGFFVHYCRKFGTSTRKLVRYGVGGVISGYEHESVEQVAHRELFSLAYSHTGTSIGNGTYGECFVEVCGIFQSNYAGKYLCCTCRIKLGITLLVVYYSPRICVHKQKVWGRNAFRVKLGTT